ncbi:TDP1 [Symbiodinium sp. CCMP2592]|nr:TDP1 [Symbiodinium sp. CCMP2592]
MGVARLAAATAALFYDGWGTDAHLVKGISYGPMPCKGPCTVSQDDFFSQSAKPMWGRRGRGDLEVIRQLGANMVRLYGNNPENTHRDFLDEAQELGLTVVPGLSDYDFIQSPANCLTTDFNCYKQVRDSYKELLKNGFLHEGT